MENITRLKDLFINLPSNDFIQTDLRAAYEQLYQTLRPIAESLHIARVTVTLPTDEHADTNQNPDELLAFTFAQAPHGKDDALTFESEPVDLRHGAAVSVYPQQGYVWTQSENREISALAHFSLSEISRKRMRHSLEKMCFSDPLTGLLNYAGAVQCGQMICEQGDTQAYAAVCVDINGFKRINESFGSSVGDSVLRLFAGILRDAVKSETECVARLGADRFFTLVRKTHLQSFIDAVRTPVLTLQTPNGTQELQIFTWIGVYPAQSQDPANILLSRAAFALEHGKQKSKSVFYFDQDRTESVLFEKSILSALSDAIRHGQIEVYYQPKVRLSDGLLVGCEALARWKKDGVFIPPTDFISAAENNGLISQLDMYMLERVCRDLRKWLDSGIEPVCVSVNYSRLDFALPSLAENTLAVLRRHGIDSRYLEIEITETPTCEYLQQTGAFIDAMHQNGVTVSLDDFGSGYSSLQAFRNLNLDTIKLDRSFFDGISEEDGKSNNILRAVMNMVHAQNMLSVVEGVEDAAQLKLIRSAGGKIVQGYFFDRPLLPEDFTQRLCSKRYDKAISAS